MSCYYILALCLVVFNNAMAYASGNRPFLLLVVAFSAIALVPLMIDLPVFSAVLAAFGTMAVAIMMSTCPAPDKKK